MTEPKTLHSWREALGVYLKPRVVAMFFLGFSAGLPFVAVMFTLSAWLAKAGIDRATIGFFSWIGFTYSLKVLWAPVVDSIGIPYLTRLFGQRRSWLLLSQSGIACGLLLIAFTHPQEHLALFAFYAFVVAFSSATQDVAIDAYRIEALDKEYQAAMSASYVYGYKIAGLAGGAGALYIADFSNWQLTYVTMAALTAVGIITTIIIREPWRPIPSDTIALQQKLITNVEKHIHVKGVMQRFTEWFTSSVIGPFADFFQRHGKLALVILLLIGTYRITDITMGVMANPFYIDMGFTLSEIASITKLFSVVMFFVGVLIAGILAVRFGVIKILLLGGILVVASNLLFAWLSQIGPDIAMLAVVISADSLASGIATTAFIAYLSSLTNTAYTATQYAMFTSVMTLFPKAIAGFSGVVVQNFGYFTFYIYASALGLPALLIVIYLIRHKPEPGT